MNVWGGSKKRNNNVLFFILLNSDILASLFMHNIWMWFSDEQICIVYINMYHVN